MSLGKKLLFTAVAVAGAAAVAYATSPTFRSRVDQIRTTFQNDFRMRSQELEDLLVPDEDQVAEARSRRHAHDDDDFDF